MTDLYDDEPIPHDADPSTPPVDERGLPDPLFADRVLRYHAREVNTRAQLAAAYDDEISGLRERADRILASCDARIARAASLLHGWHAATLAADPKRKTIPLPAGTLKSSKAAVKVTVVHPSDFMVWADKEAPGLVRHPPAPDPAPDIAAFRSYITAAADAGLPVIHLAENGDVVVDGEVVPGIRWAPGGDYGDGRHWKIETPLGWTGEA